MRPWAWQLGQHNLGLQFAFTSVSMTASYVRRTFAMPLMETSVSQRTSCNLWYLGLQHRQLQYAGLAGTWYVVILFFVGMASFKETPPLTVTLRDG